MSRLTHAHPYPGKLFVVEGIDGSGKSTQLDLLHKWLVAEGYNVFFHGVEFVAPCQADEQKG